MTIKERLYIYDTTLRDGQQTQGVTFSLDDKLRITQLLENIGIDYIEGGWPGANPVDSEFFDTKKEFALEGRFASYTQFYYSILL